ncbi:transcriptional regulator, GntR family [Edaphobacillus lindanitolerans]|uniref:Transcriptional regulator, GntR family n=2 Tax=Edaphobacillus lindanitolerans TaxID=550447 RepID=A0A1U7PTT9_9BACI|nr:transcriptional regulator, GntR family [Edaphobacillus lindanitolerans]
MLIVPIDREDGGPIYVQIYEGVRNKITDGSLPVGTKLPSKRKFAETLSVSNTTVELAYGQLLAEGYISSRPRSGFFVQDVGELAYAPPSASGPPVQSGPLQPPPADYEYDFSPGRIDTESFPFDAWRKQAKSVIDESSADLLLLGHPHGEPELRQEIARYLNHSRGVACTPEQIIIGSGTEQLMPLVIRLLGPDTIYAIEDPGYPLTHHIFRRNDRRAIPVPVDNEGIDVLRLGETGANAAYVTPAHQFPTGAVLSAHRRSQLLAWASEKPDRYIIEDDYDSEFRYGGIPVPALQGMGRSDRVLYISTFSKSLMPSLRIAYMVLPPRLLPRYSELFAHYASTVPRFDQHILAGFMRDGSFSRHLNRMRKVYRRKYTALTAALAPYSNSVRYEDSQAGMHLRLSVRTDRTEEELVALAARAGIRVQGAGSYSISPVPREGIAEIVLGFGGIPDKRIPAVIRMLMDCWSVPGGIR